MIHVVGGTYHEHCADPRTGLRLMGSGLRGALLCRKHNSEVTYSSCVGKEDKRVLDVLLASNGIKPGMVELIPQTYSFHYDHPLSTPVILPLSPFDYAKLEAASDNILQYGMLEAIPSLRCKRLVYDPQSKYRALPFDKGGSKVEEVAIIANKGEGAMLANLPRSTWKTSSAEKVAQALLNDLRVKVVVIKMGPEGAAVFTRDHPKALVSVYVTDRIMKIGSGDVFSAAFAVAWCHLRLSPVESAAHASAAAAAYCNSGKIPTKDDVDRASSSFTSLAIAGSPSDYLIYLAGPFFSLGQRWLVNQARQALLGMGFNVFSPFHDVGLGDADAVVPKDIEKIVQCKAMYALVDGCDPGTIFEIGYARALDKPVIAFTEYEGLEHLKMLQGTNCKLTHDFSSSIYQVLWSLRSA